MGQPLSLSSHPARSLGLRAWEIATLSSQLDPVRLHVLASVLLPTAVPWKRRSRPSTRALISVQCPGETLCASHGHVLSCFITIPYSGLILSLRALPGKVFSMRPATLRRSYGAPYVERFVQVQESLGGEVFRNAFFDTYWVRQGEEEGDEEELLLRELQGCL